MTEKRVKYAPGVIPAKAGIQAKSCKRARRMRYVLEEVVRSGLTDHEC